MFSHLDYNTNFKCHVDPAVVGEASQKDIKNYKL